MIESPSVYVPGCAVEYRGPTDTRGSQWVAVIRRGRKRSDCYRAAVPFQDGPDAAAQAAVDRFNAELIPDGLGLWQIIGAALSMDGGDRYAYPVGPANLCDRLPRTPEP